MQLTVGHQYELVDLEIPQGLPGVHPRLALSELLDYKGQKILYGIKPSHYNHVYIHGFVPIPPRAVCCVVLPQEHPLNVVRFSLGLKGRKLALKDDVSETLLPIVNWAARLGDLWWSPQMVTVSREEFIRRAALVIDLYHEWRDAGEFPTWFRVRRAKQGPAAIPARPGLIVPGVN